MAGSLNPRQSLDNVAAAQFAREFVSTPRREFNARFDPEAASIVSRAGWRAITVVPVDPSTATQLTTTLIDRLNAAADPSTARFVAGLEPGFPLWDEVAAGAWLDPAIVTAKQTLYVDYETHFGAGYGDLLSSREGYQPGVGEQPAEVVQKIDAARLEAVMVKLVARHAGAAGRR